MDKLRGCFLSALLLLAVINSVSAQETQDIPESGTLQLRPKFPGEITSIQWKHNSNLVAEWVKDVVELLYYGGFNGRTTLDKTTGNLEIRKMNLTDSGVYTVEINNKVQPERYNVVVIKAVPKPVVLLQPLACTPALPNCSLLCHGNTEGAGPVTYSWKMGEGEWMDGEKVRIITNDETIQSVKTFSCRMKNLISEEESDPKPNPFFAEMVSSGSGAGLGVGLFLLFSCLAGLGVLGYCKREYIKKKIFSEPHNPVSTEYSSVQVAEDGHEKKETNSSQPVSGSGETNDGKPGEENGASEKPSPENERNHVENA